MVMFLKHSLSPLALILRVESLFPFKKVYTK